MASHAAGSESGAVRARGVIVAIVVAAVAVGAAFAVEGSRRPVQGPAHYTLTLRDYAFEPAHIVWRAGDRVTLTVVNRTQSVPGKPHEVMFGREPWRVAGPFGPRQRDGFLVDLLQGPLEVSEAQGVSMLMLRDLSLTGEADALLAPAMGGMGGMGGAAGGSGASTDSMSTGSMAGASTSGASTSGGSMSGDSTGSPAGAAGAGMSGEAPGGSMAGGSDAGTGMPSDGSSAGGMPGNGMDGAAGGMGGMGGMAMDMFMSKDLVGKLEPEAEDMKGNYMLVVQPGGRFTMSFTVPDKPGEWTYGCFQQSGEHFLNGMKGTVTILPREGAGA